MVVPALLTVFLSFQVTFSYENSKAKEVKFASDLTKWDKPLVMKKNGKKFTITIDAKRDSKILYKFIVDGEWKLDPKNKKKVDNKVGSENSVYMGPDFKEPKK